MVSASTGLDGSDLFGRDNPPGNLISYFRFHHSNGFHGPKTKEVHQSILDQARTAEPLAG